MTGCGIVAYDDYAGVERVVRSIPKKALCMRITITGITYRSREANRTCQKSWAAEDVAKQGKAEGEALFPTQCVRDLRFWRWVDGDADRGEKLGK